MNILYFTLGFFSLFMFLIAFFFHFLQKKYASHSDNVSLGSSFSEIEILSQDSE